MTLTALPDMPVVRHGDDLSRIILDGLERAGEQLQSGDLLILAQKIVSKSEGRFVVLDHVTPSTRAHEIAAACGKDPRVVELVLSESREVVRCAPGVLVVENRLGMVMADAGIDMSNLDGKPGDEEMVLLLPADPDGSAAALRSELQRLTGATVGIIINDSIGRAWRLGSVGTAIGVAGLDPLIDLRGVRDRADRELKSTRVAAGDEAAAAASLLMGQAAEGRPVIHLRGYPYKAATGTARGLVRSKHEDLFR